MTMTEAADDARLAPGSNLPPLDEVLGEETAVDLRRATELVDAANNAEVTNTESQKLVTALAGLIRTHYDEVEEKRKARKRPFDQGALEVQKAYKPILDPLTAALNRLRSLNDAYEAELDRARAAERRRLAEEEETKCREAEEAARKAEEAKASGTSRLADDLAAVRARDEAAAAAARARQAETAPTLVRTDVGTSGRTTVTSYEIGDLTMCLTYLRRTQRAALIDAIQPLVNRIGRAKILIPGVKVVEQKSTRFGR